MSYRDDFKTTTHPSFGVINISRGTHTRGVSGSEKMVLFGSSIPHTSFIEIEIHRASLDRGLHGDWIHSEGRAIVSIFMSPSQFANAITSLNQGEGTPCTISSVDGLPVESPPYENKRAQFDDEFEEEMTEIASNTNKYYTKINEILLKPSIGKRDKEEIMNQLDHLRGSIAENVPFIKGRFTEQMDKTVIEAKAEVSAFIDNQLKTLGLEGFKEKLALEFLPEDEKK